MDRSALQKVCSKIPSRFVLIFAKSLFGLEDSAFLVALHSAGLVLSFAVAPFGVDPNLVGLCLVPWFHHMHSDSPVPPLFSPHRTLLTSRRRIAEFKEIRKEWKARKKEEENARKAAEERDRQNAQANQVDGQQGDPQGPPASYPPGVRPQLPPIGYAPADGQVPPQYAAGGMAYPQGNGQIGYPGSYPHSPYGQQYPQREPSTSVPSRRRMS
jgi:hypothetical protein